MANDRGRPKKYLRIDQFNTWVENDFKHLVEKVASNRKLLVYILIAVIAIPTIFMVCIVQLLG